jgi:hypothetical protein
MYVCMYMYIHIHIHAYRYTHINAYTEGVPRVICLF